MTAVCTLIPNTTNVGMSAASSNGKKTDNGDTWIFQLSSFPAFQHSLPYWMLQYFAIASVFQNRFC
jgi:hypothetical protein